MNDRRPRTTMPAVSLLVIPLSVLLVFHVIPAAGGVLLSLFDYNGTRTLPRWIGIANYTELFVRDPVFWQVTRNTLTYAVTTVPLTLLLSFGLALILNAPWFIGRSLIRTVFFIPSIVSIVAIGFVWQWVLNPSLGLMNRVLDLIGLPALGWLGDPALAMPCIILVSVWRGIGFSMIIYLAAFQQIPSHYYEAAAVDGATGWQQTRAITFPLVSATTFFLLVTGLIGAFQVFDIIYIMTGGGPANATNTLNNHLYSQFTQSRLGYCSAISVCMFAIIMLVTLIQWRLYRRTE